MAKNTDRAWAMQHKGIIYAACLILILFYLVNMWWLLTPNVGIEYKMYYITHELSDWPGYGNLSYTLGTTEVCTGRWDKEGNLVDYTVCMRKGTGWERNQDMGSKSCDNESFIYYMPKESSDSGILTIQVKDIWCTNNKGICVYVNNKKVGMFNTSGQHKFTIENYEKDELLCVKFDTGDNEFLLWSVCLDSF